jgi:hypothetical protein
MSLIALVLIMALRGNLSINIYYEKPETGINFNKMN